MCTNGIHPYFFSRSESDILGKYPFQVGGHSCIRPVAGRSSYWKEFFLGLCHHPVFPSIKSEIMRV